MKVSGSTESSISSVNRANSLIAPEQDSFVRAIQKQKFNLHKQRLGVTANKEMTDKEKEQTRAELKQRLNNLNEQLNGKNADAVKGKSEKAVDGVKETANVEIGDESSEVLFEEEFLRGVYNADASLKQVSAARIAMMKMGARIKTLETEIRMDSARGVATAKKEEALSDIKSKLFDISNKLNRPDATGSGKAEIAYKSIKDGNSGDKSVKAEDEVILQVETRIPLKLRKVWLHSGTRLVNVKL